MINSKYNEKIRKILLVLNTCCTSTMYSLN